MHEDIYTELRQGWGVGAGSVAVGGEPQVLIESHSSASSILRVLSLSRLLFTALQTRVFPASPVSQVKQASRQDGIQICLHLFLRSCIFIFCLIYLLVVVQSLSCGQLFVIPWTAASQAFLSFTRYSSLLKLTFIESGMPSNCLIPCRPSSLALIFPSIRVFSSESALLIRWPKCWSFSFSICPSNECSRLISFRID